MNFTSAIKYLFLIIATVSLNSSIKAQSGADTLSENARFTILTCSPGADLYSLFGHTAIRLEDNTSTASFDVVFNYGTFDFDTDNFYVKFARGQLPYHLTASSFANFQIEYLETGRGIWEQELLLTQKEKQKLFELLFENHKPENREYRYDFFYDNCSTRIRDIISQALDNEINFKYTYPRKHTFRQAIQSYLDYQPWSDFGIDLALGMPCDNEIQKTQCMFLPDTLMKEFNYCQHANRALTLPIKELLPQEFEPTKNSLVTPLFIFSLFLLVHIIVGWWWVKKKNKSFQITDRVLFFVTGCIGVLVFFLWFFTDHQTTKWNLNILWANPILIFMAFLPSKSWTGWKRNFIVCYFFLLIGVLFTWFFLPQKFHLAVLLLCLSLAFSCLKIIRPHIFNGHKTRIN